MINIEVKNLFVGELEFFGLVGILTSKFNSRRIFEFGDLKVTPHPISPPPNLLGFIYFFNFFYKNIGKFL
jgi:hypothetical protein